MTQAPLNAAELLARIKPTRKRDEIQLCLSSDLLDMWEDLQEKLGEAYAEDATRKTGITKSSSNASPKTRKLAEELATLEGLIENASAWFRVEAMPSDKYEDLCDQHPPRPGNELDLYRGFNRRAVEIASVRESVYDPVFDDESWEAFRETINPGEWQTLKNLTSIVNGVREIPKSELAAAILRQRKPAAGGSRQRKSGE